MIELVDSINTFLPSKQDETVSPEDPIFVLSASQLQCIITAAVEDATKSILTALLALDGRITALEDRSVVIEAQEKADIARVVADQDLLGDNQLIQLQLINKLRESIAKKPDNSPLIDELYQHMRIVGLKQTTFAGAAKILKRSKGRIKQLHPLLAMDQRFIILPSESHKQRLVIRLREFYELV